jgi:hypothetical protein
MRHLCHDAEGGKPRRLTEGTVTRSGPAGRRWKLDLFRFQQDRGLAKCGRSHEGRGESVQVTRQVAVRDLLLDGSSIYYTKRPVSGKFIAGGDETLVYEPLQSDFGP